MVLVVSLSSLVADITDICQVSVGSSLCLLGGWWRRRRWWRWWWTSCTSRTVAHCCLPQGLPAQLGEHAVSPMAGAPPDRPLLVVLFLIILSSCSRDNHEPRSPFIVDLLSTLPRALSRRLHHSTIDTTSRCQAKNRSRCDPPVSGSGSEGWRTRDLDEYLRRNDRWRITSGSVLRFIGLCVAAETGSSFTVISFYDIRRIPWWRFYKGDRSEYSNPLYMASYSIKAQIASLGHRKFPAVYLVSDSIPISTSRYFIMFLRTFIRWYAEIYTSRRELIRDSEKMLEQTTPT